MKKIIRCVICMCMVFQTAAITPKAEVLAASSDIQTLQQGNSNALMDLETDITGDAGSGVTYMNSTEVINSTPDTKYKNSSPQLAIDGDISTYYSSGLYYNQPEPENDYIQIELPTVQEIYTVNLVPKKYGTSFPYDVEIQISKDGITWTTAASKTGMSASFQEEIKISFNAKKSLKYVRVISKKLKPQGSSDYYAQYAEIRLMTPSGENVALISNGAKASASNPLYGDLFDYETFFSDTIDTGVNWVNITNEFAYNNYKNNLSLDVSEAEIANFKKLKDNGINILYRFTNAPSFSEITTDKDAAAAAYIAAITPRVTMLKDYVDVWGIFGEINVRDNSYAADYAYVIKKVISAIKEIDADAEFNMATALIDYGWTKAMLDAGIADYVDIIGIHIYKDQWPVLSYPEMAGNYISNGVEITNPTQVYADYEAEIIAYKDLVRSYSSDMKIMVTEVSEPAGLLPDADEENLIQAKWLTRQYATDKSLGLDGTFWFTVDPISAPRIISTLVNTKGERTPAWYALQNYNTVFSSADSKTSLELNITGNTENLKYDVYKNENGTEYIIPFWYAAAFDTDFDGNLINIDLSQFGSCEVTAVDLLTGKTQDIQLTNGVVENLIARDYVTVLKVEAEAKTGIVWNEISEKQGLGLGQNGHDTRTSLSLSDEYSSDGNGSAKIEWVGSSDEGSDAQIGVSAKAIPAVAGAAAKSITMDVYLPQAVNGSDNGAIGSTLAGYVKMSNGIYLNGDGIEARTLSAGWNSVTFDAVNGVEMPFFIWKNPNKQGVIYIDNMRINYQYPNKIFDSFENYTDDWKEGGYTLEKNTDPSYVKDGEASMKIVCSSIGEDYAFVSKLLNHLNVNGKQVPLIDGYTPKTFGFWVYSDGAAAKFKPEGTELWQSVDGQGWTYLEWDIPAASSVWYNWDIDHFNQMVVKVTTPGNLYVDAMSIGYQENKHVNAGTNIWSNELKNGDNALDLSRVEAGDAMSYDVLINKTNEMNYGISIMIAGYDGNGRLMKIGMTEIAENETGELERSAGFKIESSSEAEMIQSVKGFVWNSTTMEPLINCASK